MKTCQEDCCRDLWGFKIFYFLSMFRNIEVFWGVLVIFGEFLKFIEFLGIFRVFFLKKVEFFDFYDYLVNVAEFGHPGSTGKSETL
jgi:hypothetical protein